MVAPTKLARRALSSRLGGALDSLVVQSQTPAKAAHHSLDEPKATLMLESPGLLEGFQPLQPSLDFLAQYAEAKMSRWSLQGQVPGPLKPL